MKLKNGFLTLLIIAFTVPFLTSCNSGGNAIRRMALVTIGTNSATVWGTTDDSKRIYFNPQSAIFPTYQAKNGQRSIIYFNLLDEQITGFDYNADVRVISDILTKDVVVLADTQYDTLGTNVTRVTEKFVANGYLTIGLQYYVSNSTIKHYLNLVDNQLNPDAGEIDADYINLELRHKGERDADIAGSAVSTYVSFRLSDTYDPAKQGKQGIKLKVYTDESGTTAPVYYKIKLENK